MNPETPELENAYKNGQLEMQERIIALVAHHMEVAKTFHGKNSDEHLRYKNLIEDIRHGAIN